MSKRRADQIQQAKGKPAETHVTTTPDTNPSDPSGEGQPAEGTGMANDLGKYWIVIIIWAASFTLMILFELMSALFRR